jgi:hypothetical protein
VSKVKVYDAGTASDTDYMYSTTTGRLAERHFPTVSSAYIKTAYIYNVHIRRGSIYKGSRRNRGFRLPLD